jgi:hypothetical protein
VNSKLRKGDKIILLRCGANNKERPAKVDYVNEAEFLPVVKLFGFLPIWISLLSDRFSGMWMLSDEGEKWKRLKTEGC